MKTKNLQYLGVVIVAAVGMVSCDGLGKMVKKADTVTYTVTPQPLEMHGDSVAVAISGKYPAKYFGKKVVLTVTPKLGDHALKPVTLVGEKFYDSCWSGDQQGRLCVTRGVCFAFYLFFSFKFLLILLLLFSRCV